MIILSFGIASVLYLIFLVFGNKFNTSQLIASSVIGCAVYFCYIQIATFFLTVLSIPLSIATIILVLPLIFMLGYGLYHIHLHQTDILIFMVLTIVIIGLTIRATGYTIGSTSDSVFYISMVNENAFARTWTSLDYYTGSPILTYYQPTYDFQGFYHLFSALEKLSAQIVSAPSYYPVYIWGAQILFQYLFFDSLIRIGKWLYHHHGLVVTILFSGLILMNNLTCWQTLYAYIGNSWRILFISLSMYGVYRILGKNQGKDGFWCLALGLGATVAVTSSGLFINSFIFVALLCVMIYQNRSTAELLKVWWSYGITYLFLIAYIWSSYGSISLVGVAGYLFVTLMIIGFKRLPFKYQKIASTAVVGIMITFTYGYGLIVNNQMMQFFESLENEMGVSYFALDNVKGILTVLMWLIPAIFFVKTKIKTRSFLWFFGLLIVLFINPFSYGFYTKWLTQTVHYRCYEMVFNGLTMGLLAISWKDFLDQIFRKASFAVLAGIMVIPLCITGVNAIENPYIADLQYTVDPVYRIDTNEMEMDLLLAEEVKNSGRVRVVSQGLFTKAAVNNISLSFGNVTVRTFCYYCEPEYNSRNGEAPIFNIFLPRDFADQQLYAEAPRYDEACDLLFERNFKYLLLRKDQVKEKDGVIVPIYHDLRACYSVIGENDVYVLMESNYVQ